MGRTRSLRYALRKAGRKYKQSEEGKEKVEIPRTGEVYDEEKLCGAGVFEEYLRKAWADEVYVESWKGWRRKQGCTDVRIPRGFREDEEKAEKSKRKRVPRREARSRKAAREVKGKEKAKGATAPKSGAARPPGVTTDMSEEAEPENP